MFRSILGAAGLAAAVAVALAAVAHAQSAPRPSINPNRPFPPSMSNRADMDPRVDIRKRLKKLHDEAVATQKADGGTLTPEHHAELEAKLAVLRQDACNAGMGC